VFSTLELANYKEADKFQRSYFYVSTGFAMEVRMPYSNTQNLDTNNDTNPIFLELKVIFKNRSFIT
jgi:hypothetical protein